MKITASIIYLSQSISSFNTYNNHIRIKMCANGGYCKFFANIEKLLIPKGLCNVWMALFDWINYPLFLVFWARHKEVHNIKREMYFSIQILLAKNKLHGSSTLHPQQYVCHVYF